MTQTRFVAWLESDSTPLGYANKPGQAINSQQQWAARVSEDCTSGGLNGFDYLLIPALSICAVGQETWPKPKTELLALINALISNVCQAENTAAAVCQMLLRALLWSVALQHENWKNTLGTGPRNALGSLCVAVVIFDLVGYHISVVSNSTRQKKSLYIAIYPIHIVSLADCQIYRLLGNILFFWPSPL